MLSAFPAELDALFPGTGFDAAFAAVLRLPLITVQAAITRLLMETVPIAHQAIHPAWSK